MYFSKIMGKDIPRHERMLGQGIFPAGVWSETPRSTPNCLLVEHQTKIAQLEDALIQQIYFASQVDIPQMLAFNSSSHDTNSIHIQVK